MDKKIKLIVAESQKFTREGTLLLLKDFEDIEIVLEVGNGKQVLDFLKQHHADIVLLPVSMPEMSGMETLQKITSRHKKVQVVMFDEDQKIELKATLIDNGAKTFITKNITKDELVATLRKIHITKERIVSSEIYETIIMMSTNGNSLRQTKSLSQREKEVLMYLCDGKTDRKIAEEFNLSESTIHSHRKSIYKKTNTKSAAELVKYALQNKWL